MCEGEKVYKQRQRHRVTITFEDTFPLNPEANAFEWAEHVRAREMPGLDESTLKATSVPIEESAEKKAEKPKTTVVVAFDVPEDEAEAFLEDTYDYGNETGFAVLAHLTDNTTVVGGMVVNPLAVFERVDSES